MPISSIKKNKGSISWLTDILLLLALFIPLYLAIAPIRPLASPDEGRYTEIPREMAESGDWTTPRLNGMPYFYKPPLFYWMQAASIKALGVNRVSARLPNSLMALTGIVLSYCAARALRGRLAGIWTAMILGTSALYCALGEIVTLDMAVSVFISGAMFSFIVAIKKSGAWRAVLTVLFFFFCALAVLTKGLIGILIPAAAVFIWLLFMGPSKFTSIFRKSDIIWISAGIAVFVAVALPWHVLAAIANPPYENAGGIFSKEWEGQGFFWYYIIHEHILRYIDPSTSMREQPFWFFLLIAPAGFIPWIAILPQSLGQSFKGGLGNLRAQNADMLFCAIWVAFVILFFSASSSKLIPYIIPVYPALAYITGAWLAKVWEKPGNFALKWSPRIFVALGYIASIAPAIAYPILLKDGKIPDTATALPIFASLALFMFAITTVALLLYLKGKTKAFFAASFCAIYGLLAFINPIGAIAQRPSAEPLAKYYKANAKDGDVIFIAYDYGVFQDLPVWLGHLTYMIGDAPEEQKFGLMREREKHSKRFILNEKDFREFASKIDGDIYIALRERNLELLKSDMKLEPAEVARSGNLLLTKLPRKKQK